MTKLSWWRRVRGFLGYPVIEEAPGLPTTLAEHQARQAEVERLRERALVAHWNALEKARKVNERRAS